MSKTNKLPSTARGRRRLLKLADLLVANAKNKKGAKFDFGYWGEVKDENTKPGLHCGTTVCAMGLAAVSGKFKGLSWEIHSNTWNGSRLTVIHGKGRKRQLGMDAAQATFDIVYDEAAFLFANAPIPMEGAEGERALAKIIRKFVKGKDVGISYED